MRCSLFGSFATARHRPHSDPMDEDVREIGRGGIDIPRAA